MASAASRKASVYMRVSSAYSPTKGEKATSAAASAPARAPKGRQTAHADAGTASTAKTTDSACVLDGVEPKIPLHRCSSR